ncbi:astacin-like metalloendopeptidase [Pelobates cultripes]|nr:astacin-like metalloendopeptidase [Pelobates cultripes]
MSTRTYLILIYYLLGAGLFLPLQISSSVDTSVGGSNIEDEEDVFSVIAKHNKGNKKLMTQGDIAVRLSRSALGCPSKSCFWPKSVMGIVNIPYTLSSDYAPADTMVILSAMQEYTTLTCVHFTERKTEVDYVQIRSVDGCWSYLGRIGGPQDLSLLKYSCVAKGIVQHELNHVLGFVHEHTRSDRDSYVDIVWANIANGHASNFESEPNTNNLFSPYDYTSVMHYGRYAFSNVQGQPTINPKPDATVPIGQRYGLSSLDLLKINRLYECDICSFLLTEPSGFLSSANMDTVSLNKSVCVWLIRVPATKIYLQFRTLHTVSGSSGYMKVYDGVSKTYPVLLSRAFQGGVDLPPLVSSGNLMMLEFSRIGSSSFTASYSTVTCGETATSVNGILSSPGYPIRYPASTDCTWTIVAAVGYRILLEFTFFSLETSRNCIYDYLSISDGSSSGPEKVCGVKKIPTLVSTGSWLMLQFHSDKTVQCVGLQAKFSWVALP